MSEEAGENKPKRLRLSRESSNPPEAESSTEAASGPAEADQPAAPKEQESGLKSVPKFKLSKTNEESPSPQSPVEPVAPPPIREVPPTDPIKKDEIGSPLPSEKEDPEPTASEAPEELPPPLPRKTAQPAPQPVVTESPSSLDQAIDKIEGGSQKSNPLAGILVIVVLLLIFGGGGFGIWYVLSGISSEQSEIIDETNSGSTSGYGATLDKAKDVIGAASDKTLEEVMEGIPAEGGETPGPELVFEAPPKTSPKEQKKITDFLENAVYGGVRSGMNARVVMNGESYRAGDEIFEIVGLVFVGTKDGQLVFRDKNGIVYTKRF
ncbi:MAG: hypothetical protein AAGH40_13205 [Verrucomicrobiota bacterium]